LWTTQGRLLHPRPAIPTAFSDLKTKEVSNKSKKAICENDEKKAANV